MTQKTRSAVETEISSLLADNTSGNITAADLRTVVNDICDSSLFILSDTQADIAAGALSATTASFTGDVTIATGKALQTDTTTAHTLLFKAYDVDGVAYKTFMTLTNGNTPALAITAPSGGTIAVDGASIGANTAGSGAFTTLSATGAITGGSSADIAINTNKFTVAASTGNTLVAGTLAVTGVVALTTYLKKDVGNALTAVGTTRTDALALTHSINNVTTATAGTGVTLPASAVGMNITIYNNGASLIQVYGAGSDTIDGAAGTVGVPLTNAKRCRYECVAANTWLSYQLGVVSA